MRVECPMEDKLKQMGVVVGRLMDMIDKLNLRLEQFNICSEEALIRLEALERKLKEMDDNENMEDNSDDKR